MLWLNEIGSCPTTTRRNEQLESIKAEVDDLATAGPLNYLESSSLTTKLSVAQKSMRQRRDTAAFNTLCAFIEQVAALVDSEKLTAEEGQALIDMVRAVAGRVSG